MAWMVSIVLITFYLVGRYAFHETSLISALPLVAVLVLAIDFLLARYLKGKPPKNNSA